MTRQTLACAVLLLIPAGCGPVQTIESDFTGLRGQPIASVIARLGPPESRQGTTSVWTDRVRDDTPVRAQRVVYYNGQPTTIDVMVRPDPPIQRTCVLTVHTDAAGVIVSVEREHRVCADGSQARGLGFPVDGIGSAA
jgi:hypothetical protein